MSSISIKRVRERLAAVVAAHGAFAQYAYLEINQEGAAVVVKVSTSEVVVQEFETVSELERWINDSNDGG